VAAQRLVVGVDLGGAVSATTALAVLAGKRAERPDLVRAELLPAAPDPATGEDVLWRAIAELRADVVAVDAPLTMPPCVCCSESCAGPGAGCEDLDARLLWQQGGNPAAGRRCEAHVRDVVGTRPLPAMQLGTLCARGVLLARRARLCRPRVEVLEVYPRASLTVLSARHDGLAPRRRNEPEDAFLARAGDGLGELVGGVADHLPLGLHEIDAVAAAYTAWLSPGGVARPPVGWPASGGWITYPLR
jgi:predicted nuclease with RNAse H fold